MAAVKPQLRQAIVVRGERTARTLGGESQCHEALREFRLDELMSDIAWSGRTTGRVRGPESLMAEALQGPRLALK